MLIIQVYAPTSDYDDEVVEAFYEDVNKAFEENKAMYTIVMGDFNAIVDERQPEEETILGKFGYGQRNKRGDMLLEFAAQHKLIMLIVANSPFKKNKDRYWTWEAPMEIQGIKYIIFSAAKEVSSRTSEVTTEWLETKFT